MKYYNSFSMPAFSGKELKAASRLLRKEHPNGPRVQSTIKPDKDYSFNEIANNIRPTLLEISKSLY